MADLRHRFRPLGQWPGRATPTAARKQSQFKATYPATLDLLFSEAEKLGARELVLQVDIAERWIRTDGLPAANARFGANPGVIVSFDSAHGPLRYATDKYTEWQDNLRAIALSLESLRAVDRYGVSNRGEQYTGWRAIEAATSSSFTTADEALQWMRAYYAADRGFRPEEVKQLTAKELHRRMTKMLHPDAGGDPADWQRLDKARQLLTADKQL